MLRLLDFVSSEAGPFLIADAGIAQKWQGADGDGTDYARAIEETEESLNAQGKIITIGDEFGLIWQMEGAGSCPVFLEDQKVLIVQVWLEDANNGIIDTELAQSPGTDKAMLGSIVVTSGTLAILWAPESGECITGTEISADSAPPQGDLSIDGSSLLVRVRNGHYEAWHDVVQVEGGEGRRLSLIMHPSSSR